MSTGSPTGPDDAGARSAPDLAREMAEFPDMNPGPVLRLDLNGHIEQLNRAARSAIGADRVEGLCWLDVCPGMTPDLWKTIKTSDAPVLFESEIGGRCTQYTHVRRPRSGHIFVYGADITDLRLAERAIARQREELAEMARFPDMNPGPVLRVDSTGCIVLANRAANRVFDEPRLEGRLWIDVCPAARPVWEDPSTFENGAATEVKLGDRHLVFTHTPRTDAGNVFIYGADITEQKIAEHVVAQNEKMATLGTLSAGVAHEINNPAAAAVRASGHLRRAVSQLQESQIRLAALALEPAEREALLEVERWLRDFETEAASLSPLDRSDREEAIELWLDTLGVDDAWHLTADLVEAGLRAEDLDRMCANIRPEHAGPVVGWIARSVTLYGLLDVVHHGASRISEIVGALREYSFLDQAPVQDVDVNRGIRNTLIILRSKFKKGIEVKEDLDDDIPRITAFGSQLNQVWTNLLDNASSVLEPGGSITVRSRPDGDGVCVEIVDDGPGIPEEIQGRIFDAFFTTKALGEGTGLGLHTCWKIVVDRHGGRLTLRSRPGETCFRVVLPPAPPSKRKRT